MLRNKNPARMAKAKVAIDVAPVNGGLRKNPELEQRLVPMQLDRHKGAQADRRDGEQAHDLG